MPLFAGTRLGPYEIVAPIGAGGMGDVYKARDTRLDRTIAIKVSKQEFSERFDREARTIAALNHTNICQVYDVGPNYLVMELVDGAPLKGPLPLERALAYAAQILDALEAAHKKGIVHRDLKPGNILVTKQGIKLLDFGLAKAASPLKETDATVTSALTSQGQILGTLQYMAPEQLQGREADARSDLFAFGCVLYEMLSGKRAFEGANAASVIAAIMEREPASIRDVAPAVLDQVLRRSLEKDPEQRWQSARDLRSALELATVPESPLQPARGKPLPWVAAALFAILAFVFWLLWHQSAPNERAVHFQVNPPAGAQFVRGMAGGSAIAPNGRMLAFVAVTSGMPKIWIRPMDSLAAHEIPDTDGAQLPFWSPDSRSLGFFADGKLKRIDLSGGSSVSLAEAPAPRGGTWNTEGVILFARGTIRSLQRVSASGGTTTSVTTLDSAAHENSHRWPLFLPGGRRFIYFVLNADSRMNGLFMSSLDRPSERTRLIESSSGGWYVPPRGHSPGYLLWLRQETLMVRPFDPDSARFTGEALPVPGAEAISFISGNYSEISASVDGTVLFRNGDGRFQLNWFDREGRNLGSVGQPDRYASIRISPDGTRVAVSIANSFGNADASTIDFARGVQTVVTSGGNAMMTIWSPDSRRIDYFLAVGNSVFERNATGAGRQETILESPHTLYADDWSPDGRYLLYEEYDSSGYPNLRLLPRTGGESGERKPIPYLRQGSMLTNGQFSPDGKWVAYTSDASGRQQIYVQSFPASNEAKWQVSPGGGNFARWSRNGKELFYRALDGRLMVASVRAAGSGLEFGKPATLFRTVEPVTARTFPYDISPDGQRILALNTGSEDSSTALNVLINWQADIKR